ncbi:hypothetical protein EGW08_020736 [Elysia chlorotica]|uniref:Uncharacterized protein n=1 Tax=Elysia chlorotica TaxID=188477 RepID=A0A433SQI4_ELYCH|nr:hypothetical protein EGW08_020736 [Elysia chlorotica]
MIETSIQILRQYFTVNDTADESTPVAVDDVARSHVKNDDEEHAENTIHNKNFPALSSEAIFSVNKGTASRSLISKDVTSSKHVSDMVRSKEDVTKLCPLEVFYATTRLSTRLKTPESAPGSHFKFVDDSPRLAAMEEEMRFRQMRRKSWEAGIDEWRMRESETIASVTGASSCLESLGRFLMAGVRESVTSQKFSMDSKEEAWLRTKKALHVSPSLFWDGLFIANVALMRRRFVLNYADGLRRAKLSSRGVPWSSRDEHHGIATSLFVSPHVQLYEDTLQELLLSRACRLRTDTQKLAPRGLLVAMVAIIAPYGDPVIEYTADDMPVSSTTLRGLVWNAMSGELYGKMLITELAQPFRINESETDANFKKNCQ